MEKMEIFASTEINSFLCLLSHISCFKSSVSNLLSPVSHFLCYVSRLLSNSSCVSHVSCLTSPVSHLLSVSCVCFLLAERTFKYITTLRCKKMCTVNLQKLISIQRTQRFKEANQQTKVIQLSQRSQRSQRIETHFI